MRIVLFIFIAAIVSGCSSFHFANKTEVLEQKQLPPHLTFSGRGMASGPMLMSAMGPAGIAVGMAIDVGIAKDIEKAGFGEAYEPRAILAEAFRQATSKDKQLKKILAGRNPALFEISKLGFYENPAQQNVIFAEVEMRFSKGDWVRTYHYPADFMDAPIKPASSTFEVLKDKNSPARTLLQKALMEVFMRASSDYVASLK